jgi:hypothetical protein
MKIANLISQNFSRLKAATGIDLVALLSLGMVYASQTINYIFFDEPFQRSFKIAGVITTFFVLYSAGKWLWLSNRQNNNK